MVDEVLGMLQSRMCASGICAAVDVPDDIYFMESRSVRLAVFQLVAHAVDSMPDGGDLLISAFADDGMVELEVADSGRGDDHRLLLNDPLGTVRRLAQRFGGSVHVVNCAQGGAARILRLPHGKPFKAAA
jgi:LytS/YehU family sensor histidine kinase